jgi:hypothetical protein
MVKDRILRAIVTACIISEGTGVNRTRRARKERCVRHTCLQGPALYMYQPYDSIAFVRTKMTALSNDLSLECRSQDRSSK